MKFKAYAKICCPTRFTIREVEANSEAEAVGQALDELNMTLVGKTTKLWEVIRVEKSND